MHIKFVIRGIEMFRGGGEIYFLNIAKALQKLGCQISFVTTKPLFGDIKYPVEEFQTDYVPCPYLRDLSLRMMSDSVSLERIPFQVIKDASQRIYKHIGYRVYNFDNLVSQRRLFDFIKNKKIDYDIIQVHALAWLASRVVEKLKIPTVIRFPGPPSLIWKKDIEKCNAVIASGDTVNVIKKNFREDVYDIPPGVDSNLFRPVRNSIREEYNIGNNPLLLFVGRFVPLKNLPFLIRSFKEVVKEDNRVKLMLVGEGPLDKTVRYLVAKYKIEKNVIFTGRIPSERLPSYYSAADVFIMASSYESFSISTLEAMSCGLPVIATKVGWLPNLIKHNENGILVENGNILQLKDAIVSLLGNTELRKEMGERNREIVVSNYSWLESAKKLKRIYESLL